MEIKLAEALLRRKELQEKVDRLRQINVERLYEIKVKRTNVTESVDDIVAQVPKISFQQVTHAFDWHAKALRQVDAIIQQVNWTASVEVDSEIMSSYVDPYMEDKK